MTLSEDDFLGGQLTILQPVKGYRAGLDAVMLAAAVVDREAPFTVLDAGAGVGTAGLCVARRCASARVVLVEREPEFAALARRNVEANGLGARVSVVEADVSAVSRETLAAHNVAEGAFDQIIANPPYHAAGSGTVSSHALKAGAHVLPEAGLDDWGRFFARMTRPGGEAIIVHIASALPALLTALEGRFGGLSVRPLHPREGEPASRILLRGIKGSRAPFGLEAGLVLHDDENRFTEGAERVLRLGHGLHVAYSLSLPLAARGASERV